MNCQWAALSGPALLLMASQAWAVETTTPGVEAPYGWRDAITLGIAVFGALLSVLNFGIGIWRERRKHAADGTYLAMRLAVILEKYVDACSEMIERNANAYAPDGQELPNWDVNIPNLASYPEDTDGWRALDPNTASDCLAMRSRIEGSSRIIADVIEQDTFAIERAVRFELCDRGLEAAALADALRKTHQLRPISPVVNSAEHLRAEALKAQKEKIEIEQARTEWQKAFYKTDREAERPPS